MAKKKVPQNSDYISEKEIMINGKKAKLVKTNNHIKVTQGKKVLYDGVAGAWHRWLRLEAIKNK